MSRIYRLARKLLPASRQLAWSRSRIERGYGRSIAAARQAKADDEVQSLKSEMQFELDLQREEEDAHQTKQLLRKAMRLRVPVPPVHSHGGANSGHWYEGGQTGGWYLTVSGIREVRAEIRQEQKSRHDQRAHLVVWISAITGVIGAITGLVAVLQKHG